MVFTYLGRTFDGAEAEEMAKFAIIVAKMDMDDSRKAKRIRKREVLMTHEQLEEQAQYLEDSNKTWEDIKNECVR
jgi:hypothetical protein|tara:strand:+ start:362 stop:586 length:225 start_codon:yes stop_codon:yes gene_type:complete